MLICPICKQDLSKEKNIYLCLNNHCFDISKEGYINLLPPKLSAGDNKEMVTSRMITHQDNLYDNLCDKLCEIIKGLNMINPVILDSGCGEGYYLNYLFKKITFSGIGLDISKYAIQKAAKQNKDMLFLVASGNDIPLKNKSVDVILSVFSPWFNKSFSKVLKDNGFLIIVSPGEKHLWELKKVLYEHTYLNEEKDYNLPSFKLISSFKVEYFKEVKNIMDLIKMTPYYYKTNKEKINELNKIKTLTSTFDFKILLYQKDSSTS